MLFVISIILGVGFGIVASYFLKKISSNNKWIIQELLNCEKFIEFCYN